MRLLVVPNGGRYWRYDYRFEGKRKTLALGVYPDVPLEKARQRHRAVRYPLAAGVDPSLSRRELRTAVGVTIIPTPCLGITHEKGSIRHIANPSLINQPLKDHLGVPARAA